MEEEKKRVDSQSDRTVLETIYQTQILILGRLETLQKEVDEIKATVKDHSLYETGLTTTDSLYDTISNLESELSSLNEVDVDLPFQQIRTRQ